jgi:lysine/ornithine N-monooxygenase
MQHGGTVAKTSEIAIIGAGPYGLSLAAHLRTAGVPFRIFGSPMNTWRTQMPKGMFLKSEGFASNLYEPSGTFTLANYCAQQGIRYANVGEPVALETFSAYGLAFQQRYVPELEERSVAALERTGSGFAIRTVDGERATFRRVIVAVGISYFQYLPPELGELPEAAVSHSSGHHHLDEFKGRNVTVIGGGASALDVAALLHQSGAEVQLIARRAKLDFQAPPEQKPRSLPRRLRSPRSGLGTGWRSRLCTDMPLVFHRMPLGFRVRVVRTHLGPAPCWFVKDQVVGRIPMHLGVSLQRAEQRQGSVHLSLMYADGSKHELATDHVIAATGYKVDLGRIPFMDDGLRSQIRSDGDMPALSSDFESSIPGLHFVGASAANSFGPLLRFAFGAHFAARRLSRYLATSH